LPRYYMLELNPKHERQPIYVPFQKEKEPMTLQNFRIITEKVAQFSDDAIISLSIYGEPLSHKLFVQFVKEILSYKNLSVLVETHGTCEDAKEKITAIKDIVLNSPLRPCNTPPLYWITDIDATTASAYAKVYGIDENQAENFLKVAYQTAEYATSVFGNNAYVQIVRMNENETDVEGFYRSWKERGGEVIIQKYDHFCSCLPERRVADLSPLKRMPCRHLNRELCILSNGDVIFCHEDIKCTKIMGNVLTMNLDDIWQRFDSPCLEQSALNFGGLCELCDEYYTYNF